MALFDQINSLKNNRMSNNNNITEDIYFLTDMKEDDLVKYHSEILALDDLVKELSLIVLDSKISLSQYVKLSRRYARLQFLLMIIRNVYY